MEDIYSGIILYLIGYSGVGKRTIAKEIVKLTNAKIIDHTLVHDLIFKIVNKNDGLSKTAIRHINSIRLILLEAIIDICKMHQSFIITDELFNANPEHKRLYDQVESIAQRRGSTFIPVKLTCDSETIVERYTSVDRSNEFKNTNRLAAMKNCTENTLLGIKNSNLITLDVTDLPPSESAREIVKKMERFL